MTAEQKLAQKRLTLLQLAEKLGNVSKACRMHKVSRSQFYEYKRAFQQYGLEGLIDKPPIATTHPNAIDNKTGSRIIELSLKHPAFGKQHRGGYATREENRLKPSKWVKSAWKEAA